MKKSILILYFKIQLQNDGSNQQQQQQQQQRPRAPWGLRMLNPFGAVPGRPRVQQPGNGTVPQARPNVQAAQPNAAINGIFFSLKCYHYAKCAVLTCLKTNNNNNNNNTCNTKNCNQRKTQWL